MASAIPELGSPRGEASFRSPSRRNLAAKAVEVDRLPSSVACRSAKQQREDKWREEFQEFKAANGLADDAKVFVICPPGGYQDVREALEERGWFENTDPESGCYDFKYVIRAKDLKNPLPLDNQQLNHFFNGGCLTTKTGLAASMKQLKWHQDFHQDEIFPRAYNISNPSDRQEWEIDFRWTAAEAILRRVKMDQGLHPAGIPVDEGQAVDCAIKVLQSRIKHMNHLRDPELDWVGEAAPCLPEMTEAEWSSMLDCSYFNFELSGAESIPKEETVSGYSAGEGDDDDSDLDEGEQVHGDDLEPEGVSLEDKIMEAEGATTDSVDLARKDALEKVAGTNESGTSDRAEPLASQSGAIPQPGNEDASTRGSVMQQDGHVAPETQAAREERYKDVAAVPLPEATVKMIDQLLSEIKGKDPQYNLNGAANIWILKPGGKSRGRGIRCVNKLSDVQQLAENNLLNNAIRARTGKKKTMWVAQKYMENPLTVRRRKFDIRQWVLVTDWNPMTIWFYDACYLRFAAEEYSLANFQNRFSHLTNNTIQIKSSEFEDNDIGEGNMWDNQRFAEWLGEELGQPDAFQDRIQPAMRRCIEASLSTVRDTIKHRKATHELFGYDFIIDEDLGTWFLEVNCSPCLAHSTPVTGRLVSSMVEDMMKVLIDLPEARRQAKRGEFNVDEFDTGLWKRTSGSCGNIPVRQQAHVIAGSMQVQGSAVRIKRRRPPKMTIDPEVDSVGWIAAKAKEPSEQTGSPLAAKGERKSPLAEAGVCAGEVVGGRREALTSPLPATQQSPARSQSPDRPSTTTRVSVTEKDYQPAPRQEPKSARASNTVVSGNTSKLDQGHREPPSPEFRQRANVYGRSSSTGLLKRHESQLRCLSPATSYRMAESPEPSLSGEHSGRAIGSLSGRYAPSPTGKPREIVRFSSPSPVMPEQHGFSSASLPRMRAFHPTGALKEILENKKVPQDERPSPAEISTSNCGRYNVLKPVAAALAKAPQSNIARHNHLRTPEAVKQFRLELQDVISNTTAPVLVPLSHPPEQDGRHNIQQYWDDDSKAGDEQDRLKLSPCSTKLPVPGPYGHIQLLPQPPLRKSYPSASDRIEELLETATEKRRLLNEYAEKLQYQKLPQAQMRRVGMRLEEISPLNGSGTAKGQMIRSSAPVLPRGPGMGLIHIPKSRGGMKTTKRENLMVATNLPNSLAPPKLETCWDTQPLGKTHVVSTRANQAIKRLVGIS